MTTYQARGPEEVDYLLARAFSPSRTSKRALCHPDASVVRLDVFGGDVARGATGIREAMADYVGLAPTMDVTVHHVTHAGSLALVRSQWRIRGIDHEDAPIELHHHGMEVMRRSPAGWQFYIDHPWGADPSWAIDEPGPAPDGDVAPSAPAQG